VAAPPPRARAPLAALVPTPKPSRPTPTRDVVVLLDSTAALRPGATYRVVAVAAFGLTGIRRTSERTITAPPRDTARAARERP
jgi:hypothetical protein